MTITRKICETNRKWKKYFPNYSSEIREISEHKLWEEAEKEESKQALASSLSSWPKIFQMSRLAKFSKTNNRKQKEEEKAYDSLQLGKEIPSKPRTDRLILSTQPLQCMSILKTTEFGLASFFFSPSPFSFFWFWVSFWFSILLSFLLSPPSGFSLVC